MLPKHLLKVFISCQLLPATKLSLLPCFIVWRTSENTDNSDDEEEAGHEHGSKAKAEVSNIDSLEDMNSAEDDHDNRVGEEVEDDVSWPELSVVTEERGDMGDTNEASNASVETEDEEELLVASTNTVTQEETVMIQNVNTLSKTILYHWKIINHAGIPAVGTMMRPHWNMKITTQTFFISEIKKIGSKPYS